MSNDISETCDNKNMELKYKLSETDIKNIKFYVYGWKTIWETEYARQYGGKWISRACLFNIAVAILASGDELLQQNTDCSKTILYGLYKDRWLKHAHTVVNNHHEFMDRCYRYYYDKFDKKIHISRNEENRTLNNSSAWTLVKAFRTQVLASIDSLYERNVRGLKISLNVGNIKKKKNTIREKIRTPEEAFYRGIVGEELINTMYFLMDVYNDVLISTIDFSDYYRYVVILRNNGKKKRIQVESDKRQSISDTKKTTNVKSNNNRFAQLG